jgi:hypothetical protein
MLSVSDHTTWNGRIRDLISKDYEGNRSGLIKVLSWNLPGESQENHENP